MMDKHTVHIQDDQEGGEKQKTKERKSSSVFFFFSPKHAWCSLPHLAQCVTLVNLY